MNVLTLLRSVLPSRRAERQSSDAGITLVETLVVAALTGVVLIIVSTMTISALRTVRNVRGTADSTSDVRIAMEAVTTTLRVAVQPDDTNPAVSAAANRTVTFYASLLRGTNVGSTSVPPPTRVTYSVDTTRNCLLETKTPGTTATPTTWPSSATTSSCLARGTFNTNSTPIFTYKDSSGATLTTGNSGLSAADLANVASVDVQLSITPTGDGKTSTAATTVVLVNLGDD